MGCGASRSNIIGTLQDLQPIRTKIFIDGLDINIITSKVIHATLTTALGDNECRFEVKSTSKSNVYNLTIIPRMVDDDLQKIAENKALQMVYNQIRVRAHTGALYLGQGGCWITDTKSENADDDQSTNSSSDKAFYENILIKEALTEAWLYNIQDRSDEINLKDLTKILNWDKLELNLNEATITSIYEELPKDKTGNSVLVKNFLSKIKAVMQTAYVTNNENETYHWRKMWSQKTGQFYFNLRTGCCQYAEPRA